MFHIDFESRKTKDMLNFVKYGLTTVLVVAVTVALVFAAGGYDIDRNTGEIIQNGLVLIASEPVSADIYIDGKDEKDPTSSKFSLPVGQYNFELKRDGYHDWVKRVSVEDTDVIWLNYPRLIPIEISTNNVEAFNEVGTASQTPDKKYLLIHEEIGANKMILFSIENSDSEPVVIPPSILTTQSAIQSSFEVIDWSQDSRTVVLQHTNGATKELILLDVTKPDEALNLTTLYELQMSQLEFVGNSRDELYAVVNSSLRRIDVGTGTVSSALIHDISQYSAHDGIVAALHGKKGEEKVSLLDGGKVYEFMDLAQDATKYLIETGAYDGELYLIVADNSQGRVFVYENIIQTAKDDKGPQILSQLRLAQTKFLKFSNSSQFLMAQNGKDVRLFDFDLETKRAFTIRQEVNSASELLWIDAYHLSLIDLKSQVYFLDYDGLNTHALIETDAKLGVFYTPDGEGVYSFVDANKGSDILKFSSLVAEN